MIDSTTQQKARLMIILAAGALVFVTIFAKLPIVTIQPIYSDPFPYLIAAVFILAVIAGAMVKLEYALLAVLFIAFVFPLTRVTASADFNVLSTGMTIGAVTQLRISELRLDRKHLYLAGLILVIGAWYNLVPLFIGDTQNFSNKLWVFNLFTFAKYAAIVFLVAQAKLNRKRVLNAICWFALGYAGFVIVDAFHIPVVNWGMKSFTLFGSVQQPGMLERKALTYFRSAGLAIDAIHAGNKLSFLFARLGSRTTFCD